MFLTLAYLSQLADQLGLEGGLALSGLLGSLEALSAHALVELGPPLFLDLHCLELVLKGKRLQCPAALLLLQHFFEW